jgi:hypothetical protein
MSRYVPSNFDNIKGKAKLFHRSIELMQDDGIVLIKPNYRLTDAQADLARVLGFEDWAELKNVMSKGTEASRVDDETFSSMARKLSSITGSGLLSTSLLARLGFAGDLGKVSSSSALTAMSSASSATEFARGIDLLTERLMEIDPSAREAWNILGIIENCHLAADSHLGMIGYVESLLAWARFAIRGEKSQLAKRFVDHSAIERIGEALPTRGFFVMGGATGTGRSHAGIVLAKHMRARRRVVFSLAAQSGIPDRRTKTPGSVVFIDDRPFDDATFDRLVEIARHSLVVLCQIARDHVAARNWIWFSLHSSGRSREDASALAAGGVHCEVSDRDEGQASLTPWNPHTGYPHTTYYVNDEGRVFDNLDSHLNALFLKTLLDFPCTSDQRIDRAAVHMALAEAVATTTDQRVWRERDLSMLITRKLDEMERIYPWVNFETAADGMSQHAS